MTEQGNTNLVDNGGKAPTLWGWPTYLSMAVTVSILVVLASMVDLDRIWREVAACEKKFVFLGMLAHYATYPIRGLRWRRCLRHLPIRCGNAKFGLLVFFYNAVDNVVPAKLGDVYGAHLAGINCGIRRSTTMGSIVFLRTVDAWVLLLLALPTSWFLFSHRLPPAVVWALAGGGLIAVIATFIMLVFFLLRRSLPGWLPEKVQQMIRAFHKGMWPRPGELVSVAVLTAAIWALEILWIFFLVLGFGFQFSAAETIFLTMIPLLATAFPLTPSGAGLVELTLFGCLRVLSVSAPLAVSLTVVNRFIGYWLHIVLGVLIWAVRGKIGLRTWREVRPREPEKPHSVKSLISQEHFS